jgi:hypothetical protein
VAGRGVYLVGPGQLYRQPQDAVSALARDQGPVPFTTTQEIRFVEPGGYEPFVVSGLRPGTVGLTISASAGVGAVIDRGLRPSRNVGIRIDHHVENVHIKNLTVRNAIVGIQFDYGAHSSIVEACRLHGNTSYGIKSWRCNEMAVVDCEVWGSRIGIAFGAGRGSVIGHNSIYSRFISSTGNHCCIAVAHEGDMRVDEHVYNNALFADGTNCLWIKSQDVEDLISDGNVFYAPGGAIANVFTPKRTTPIRVIPARDDRYTTIAAWNLRSRQDRNSVYLTPGFRKISPDSNGSTISLEPVSNSGLYERALDLTTHKVVRSYTEVGSWIDFQDDALPAWFNTSTLTSDIQGTRRATIATVGAYERPVQGDPLNDNPEEQPDDTDTGVGLECGDRVSIIDRIVLQMKQHVPCWNPEVHRGYFWVRDMPYYLYAKKKGVLLGDITFSEFDLDVEPNDTGLDVRVGTFEIPSMNWDRHGPMLRVHHEGLEVGCLGDAVTIEGDYNQWDTGIDGFRERNIKYEFSLARARRRYLLPSDHMDAGPVVVTDDTVNAMNEPTHLPMQFMVGDPVPPWGSEIHFRNPNLLENSAFHYTTASLPDDWGYDTGGTAPTMLSVLDQGTGEYDIHPYHGDYFVKLESDQWLEQVVKINRHRTHTLSFFVSAENGLTGQYAARVDELDHMKRLVKTGSSFISGTHASDTGISTPDPWVRVAGQVPDMDTGTMYIAVRINGTDLLLDGVQLEEADTGSQYAHLPRPDDMTVEYETSDRLYYKVCDLDLSPFRNRMHEGFLHIPAVPARQFDPESPVDATTVSDWRWAKGRTDHLPWAKVHGVNKWRRVRHWDDENILAVAREAAFGLRVRQPRVVLIAPEVPVVRQSSRGIEIAAEVRNEAENPYAFEEVSLLVKEDHGKYPGQLARREYGYFTHLGTEITPESNNRGEVVARYIPPWTEDVEYRGQLPTAGGGAVFLDMPYRVHKGNHGNASLHDQFGNLIELTGEQVTEVVNPRIEGDYSIYDLQGRPHFGTLVVQEHDGETGWNYPLGETRNPLMDDTEYFVNYETNRVAVFGTTRLPVRVAFTRRMTWTDRLFPRRIYFDEAAVSGLTGEILVRYDAEVSLTVRADKPQGITRGSSAHRTIPVVAQNPHRGEVE